MQHTVLLYRSAALHSSFLATDPYTVTECAMFQFGLDTMLETTQPGIKILRVLWIDFARLKTRTDVDLAMQICKITRKLISNSSWKPSFEFDGLR